MKLRTTSLLAIGILALATSIQTAHAANYVKTNTYFYQAEQQQPSKKLIISGNVEVTIVQADPNPKLYANHGTVKARVYTTDNAIYVTGRKKDEMAKVTLYVNDIYRIDACGNAVVKTQSTLNLQYLQIILKDNAIADISSKTESLYTKLAGSSSLKLNGTARLHAINKEQLAQLNTNNFKASKTEVETTPAG